MHTELSITFCFYYLLLLLPFAFSKYCFTFKEILGSKYVFIHISHCLDCSLINGRFDMYAEDVPRKKT
jgi:hypothetical protein